MPLAEYQAQKNPHIGGHDRLSLNCLINNGIWWLWVEGKHSHPLSQEPSIYAVSRRGGYAHCSSCRSTSRSTRRTSSQVWGKFSLGYQSL